MRAFVVVFLVTVVAVVAAAQTQPTNAPPPTTAPAVQPPPAQTDPAVKPSDPKAPSPASPGQINPRAAEMKKMDPVESAVNRLNQRLSLSEDQKTKIKALLQAEREQTQALRSNSALTPQQRMEKQRTLRKETQEKVKGLLTPEQLKKYEVTKPQPPAAAGIASEPAPAVASE